MELNENSARLEARPGPRESSDNNAVDTSGSPISATEALGVPTQTSNISTPISRAEDGVKVKTGERVLTGVSGSFTATHLCAEVGYHEHTWHVTAWFQTPVHADARCYKASLNTLLARWHGKRLPEDTEWGEDIARVIGKLCNCVEVLVSRPDEGIYARWLA